LATAPRGGA